MYLLKESLDLDFDLAQGFIFDIETTGLNPAYSRLAMVGYLYQEEGKWVLHQELAQSPEDEKKLLLNFHKLSSKFLYTVHYNGSSFDLPFVNRRSEKLGLASPFDKRRGFDLYLHLRKKKISGSLKLNVQEKKAGYVRRDNLSGKEWVDTFLEYEKSGLKNKQDLLLLHNKDDLLGTLALIKRHPDFLESLDHRLVNKLLILQAYPGRDGLRLHLFDGAESYMDLEALSIDELLFSRDYKDNLPAEEKRNLLLSYGDKCFYENIKKELMKKFP